MVRLADFETEIYRQNTDHYFAVISDFLFVCTRIFIKVQKLLALNFVIFLFWRSRIIKGTSILCTEVFYFLLQLFQKKINAMHSTSSSFVTF
jgi:hypothetical protein